MALKNIMLDISVGKDGITYGVNSHLEVYLGQQQVGWHRVDPDFHAVQVAVGDSENVWAIEARTQKLCRLEGEKFVPFGESKALRVSVGSEDSAAVWLRGTDDKTYQLQDGKFVHTPSGSKALEISVFDNTTVWIIGTDDKTYELEQGQFVQTPPGSKGKQIAVDASGEVWLVGTDDRYHLWVAGSFAPVAIPWQGSGLSSIMAINRGLSG